MDAPRSCRGAASFVAAAFALWLGFGLGLGPHRVHAEDADPPSLALSTDRARSHPRIALVADAVAVLFDTYGPRLGFAAGRHQAFWLAPSFQHRFGRRGASLEVAYAIMPLGRALEGLRLAGFASAAYFPATAPVRAFRLGGEVGYAHLWGRFVLGGAAGAARRVAFGVEDDRPWEALVRAELGWVFL